MTQDTASKYYEEFKGKTFVVEVDGDVVDSRRELCRVINDVKTLIEHGIKVVLVYGKGSELENRLLNKEGASIHPETNRIVLPGRVIPLVESERVRVSILAKELCGSLGVDFEDIPLSAVKAERRIGHQASGVVSSIDIDGVDELTGEGKLPIFGFGGVDGNEEFLHVPSVRLSAELAGVLNAKKLMLLNTTGGILVPAKHGKGKKIKLSFSDLESLLCMLQRQLDVKNLTGEMIERVHATIIALSMGTEQVHIVSYKHILREILTRTGVGTMIERHQSHNVDFAKPNDLDEVMALHEEALQHTTDNGTPYINPLFSSGLI